MKDTEEKARVFDSLPKGLPPLLKAYRINSKAARNKFTWDSDERGRKTVEGRMGRNGRTALKTQDTKKPRNRNSAIIFSHWWSWAGARESRRTARLILPTRNFSDRFGKMEETGRTTRPAQSLADMDLDAMNDAVGRGQGDRRNSLSTDYNTSKG